MKGFVLYNIKRGVNWFFFQPVGRDFSRTSRGAFEYSPQQHKQNALSRFYALDTVKIYDLEKKKPLLAIHVSRSLSLSGQTSR